MWTREKTEKLLRILILAGLLALVVLIFSQCIEFTAVDLGRHLANGQFVWQHPSLLFHNFYSYTEPNFPFVNHHWLAGVIFYAVYLIGGFKFLSLFNILLILAAWLLAFNFTKQKAGFYLAALLALPTIFLLSERVEVRPEIFSYLFIILTWITIERTATDKNYKRLLKLIPLFIVWVNIHIYFFVGLALLGFKAAAEFCPVFFRNLEDWQTNLRDAWEAAKDWIKPFLYIVLACLINPNTIKGLLYPFNIFANYGYEIAENKSVFYLGHLMINYNYSLFKGLLFLLILSWAAYFFFAKKLRLFDLFLTVFFSLLALFASRNLALFSLAAWILISSNLIWPLDFLKNKFWTFAPDLKEKIRLALAGTLLLIILLGLISLMSDAQYNHKFIRGTLGWGLVAGSDDSAKFFKTNKLSGPIFNNYDLGSALIFWLYPQEKVFVDNRPEAYSSEFFTTVYKPMQINVLTWQDTVNKYQIKTVYFSHTDSTPWAREFLHQILTNNDWVLVYIDRYTVILLNRKLTDAATIKKLEINSVTFRQEVTSLVAQSNLKSKFDLADLALQANQTDLAENIYRDFLWLHPDNKTALVALGYLYSGSSDPTMLNKALTYFDWALKAGYRLPGVYNQIGLTNWQLGAYQKAKDAWTSALNLERRNTAALYYLNQVQRLQVQGKLPLLK